MGAEGQTIPGDWSVPEGWFGCECCCRDRNTHAQGHTGMILDLEAAHDPPAVAVRQVKDTDAYRVEVDYADGLTLISRSTPHKTLADALLKQQQEHDFERRNMVAWFGWTSKKRTYEDMNMNIKKTRKPGQCAAMRCIEEPLVAGAPGTPWGVDSVDLCDRHFSQCIKEYPGVFQDGEGAVVRAGEGIPEAQGASATPDPEKSREEELLERRQEAEEVTKVAREWPITSQDDLDELSGFLQDVKEMRDALAQEIKDRIGPLKRQVLDEEALYRPLKKAWDTAEATIKGRFAEARILEEERNQQAKKDAAQAFEEGRNEDVAKAMERITHVNETDGVTTLLKWDYVIEDETLLPREFLTPNLKLIKEHCNHSNDKTPTPIPGVRFIPKAEVRASRRKPEAAE